jgi:nucleotide-binding universal stress UspA family protein
MNKIIAPVDFSAVSINAARYAANMAAALNKDLMLIHIVQLPVVYGDVPMPIGEFDVSTAEATGEMEKLAKQFDEELNGQVVIHTEVKVGSPVYELVNQAKNKGAYALVMGTHGAGAVERFFLGSTTQSLVKEAECPVLVIPPDYLFKTPKKIALASDFKDVVRKTPEKAIRTIVEDFSAKLEILHADPNYKEYEPAAMEEGLLLDTMFDPQRPTFHFLHSGYTEESILNYANENDVDLLIVVPKEHNFIDSIFRHQHTGLFIRNATIPIMVIHSPHESNP